MYIDFHTHAYAGKIAQKAIATLAEEAAVSSATDGGIGDTRKKLAGWGIDLAVMLPIATKPTQTKVINDWAIKHNKGNLIFFGTVHPENEDIKGELARIKAAGLKGVKLHPDYQHFYLFEDRAKPIFSACEELGLPVTIHMGFDPYSKMTRHAMPCDLALLAKEFPRLTFIGAHMGGMANWERVLYYLKGIDNIYYDTAFMSGNISEELLIRMIDELSEDRILFGSDLPWHSSLDEKRFIENLNISGETKEKIFCKNALSLLGFKDISEVEQRLAIAKDL